MTLHITSTTDAAGRSATLRVTGDADYATTDALTDAASAVLTGTPTLRHLRLDLTGLTYCDSAGLSGLIRIHRWTSAADVRLHLDNRPDHVERLLVLTGLLDHLTAVPGAGPAEARYEGGGSNS